MTDRHVSASASQEGQLTASQIEQWRTEGYTLVSGLYPEDLIEELAREATTAFPAIGTDESDRYQGFGSQGRLVFPSEVSAFNDVTLHENLLGAVADLLGEAVTDIRLSQSDLWPKYGQASSVGDQRIHVDYPNHTLTHPTPWSRPEAVELIVYLSDWEETQGSTAVVPRQGEDDPAYRWPIVDSPGIGELQYVNDRDDAEAYFAKERPELKDWRELLYDREHYVKFRPGDVLFYRHDTWHRGTPMVPGTLRLAHNMTFRKAQSEWISTLHTGWAWSAYNQSKLLPRLISDASLNQRAVLGFPQPGSDYWCLETIEAIRARYGMYGFDVTPYLS